MTNLDLSKETTNTTSNDTSQTAPPPATEEDSDETKEHISPAEKSLLQKIIRRGLVETTKPLDIQRKNPNSPLYSIKSFEALHLLVSFINVLSHFGFKLKHVLII